MAVRGISDGVAGRRAPRGKRGGRDMVLSFDLMPVLVDQG